MGKNPKDWKRNSAKQAAEQGQTLLGNGKVVPTPDGGWPEDVREESAGTATATAEAPASGEDSDAQLDITPLTEEELQALNLADLQEAMRQLQARRGRLDLSEHDNGFISRGISDRAERIEKIAKMTKQEGYPKQAAVLYGDAAYAREEILPHFSSQLEAFGQTEAEAIAGAANVLHSILQTAELLKRPVGEVADEIARRVIAFGRDLHVRSYAAGVADRTKYSEAGLMISALDGLRKKPGDPAEDPTVN